MADETLRRNLDRAFDPGPDFPNRLLLSRTIAMLALVKQEPGRRIGVRLALPRTAWRLGAAALVLLLMAAAFGAFLTIREHARPSIPAGIPAATPSAPAPGEQPLFPKMFSASIGWGGREEAWRTTDGGAHWRNVSPSRVPESTNRKAGAESFFLDETHAWVAQSTPDYFVTFRTVDGGRTWQQGALVSAHGILPVPLFGLYFFDADHGWLNLLSDNPELYRTTDGGMHWSLLSSSRVVSGLDRVLCGTAISFVTPTTGWLTSTYCGGPATTVDQKGPIVLATHDGGVSWERQPLRYAFAAGSCACANAPVFFNSRQGVLISFLSRGPTSSAVVFITSDSGTSWTPHKLPNNLTLSITFVDASHGWALSAPGVDLFDTHDGGQTWTKVPMNLSNLPEGRFTGIQFVDAKTAFAWRTIYQGCGHESLKTADGGRTWSVVWRTTPPFTVCA